MRECSLKSGIKIIVEINFPCLTIRTIAIKPFNRFLDDPLVAMPRNRGHPWTGNFMFSYMTAVELRLHFDAHRGNFQARALIRMGCKKWLGIRLSVKKKIMLLVLLAMI